nr:netrin receptor unc-40-like [Misgurnus anguillicaudatus]
MELISLPLVILLILKIHSGQTEERLNSQLFVWPADHVFRGESVTLTCVINGEGVSSWQYRWYKDSIIQQNKLQYYTIRSVTESDAGKYTCKGKDTSGSQYSHISYAVTLTVSALSRATLSARPDRSVFTGETVILKCEIENQYSDWRYQWYKRGIAVLSSDHYTVKSDSLTINGVTNSDQSEFTCIGERDGRPQYSQLSLAVFVSMNALPGATVRVTPARSLFIGETVTLKCEIKDHNNWTYHWYKDKTKVFNTAHYIVNRDSLTITGVTEYDQGEFSCSAVIDGRPQTSHSSSAVNLTVNALPRATVRVTPDRSVFTGETVTLKCEIEDQYSNWRYLWYKDTTEVFNSGRYTVNRDSLTINGVTESDQDRFWCRGERDGRPSSSQYSDHVTLPVKGVQEAMSGFKIFTFLLAVCPYLLATVILVFKCCRLRGETSV